MERIRLIFRVIQLIRICRVAILIVSHRRLSRKAKSSSLLAPHSSRAGGTAETLLANAHRLSSVISILMTVHKFIVLLLITFFSLALLIGIAFVCHRI
jgi:hypothetical protein